MISRYADPASKPTLKKGLRDVEPNVQWGAAVSLAQMKDPSGKEVLLNLLNRQYLGQFPEVDLEEQNSLVLTAIGAAGFLDDPALDEKIKQLSETDRNMKVRAAALEALKE